MISSELYALKETLIDSKGEILREWVEEELCSDILKKHEIDTEVFVSQYASNVFDYFMGVISDEMMIGECPAMAALIEYLKHKEIRSDELFVLCTHFKRSVLNSTYRLGLNTQEVFAAISYLFDQNFAGVLKLYTDTIYQKEQEAIEAGRAKEYFLSNMSHEIRTPLNAILGFVALLKAESLGVRYQKYLDIIAQSGESLLHIINDILDFSKLRSGVFAIDPQSFDINEKMTNTLELFVPSANLKSIPISYTIAEAIPECVVTDPFRLQQIVGNLLSNAIKFSAPNQPIDVRVDVQDDSLIIEVQDYGTGIAPEDQEKIFDPFYQASEGMRFGTGGSGLGLSICRQLATQMGGMIHLTSTQGEGSLFVVTLPIERAAAEQCRQKQTLLHKVSFKGTVLVAEDNEANTELIKMLLERYALTAEFVKNGAEAVAIFQSKHYDLVLMDEQMPVMNGSEALQQILALEKHLQRPHVPIVALTANALSGAKETALEQGYDAFLTKPMELHALEDVLGRYLLQTPKVQASPRRQPKFEWLEETLGLTREQIDRLFEVFAKKIDETIPELRTAIAEKDYRKMGLLAHSLKGASLNFRYTEMARLMELIEISARGKEEDFAYEEALDVFMEAYQNSYASM